MLTKFLNKIVLYFKSQKEAQELKEMFKLDYRLEKELFAITKRD